MDTSGKIIKTYKDDLEHLDVSSVSSGNYLLFIQTSKQKIVKKVIIK
ncbi:Por secretion system C-terminal sorting domain-containing protein [Paenimyroides ummariense]|uniref:Por secretion system C-terminal sorting domain-containing protein n=2 Tax=Paenimyroides ummariense TaxID=913024 RepID=A0A1I4ZN47_9FLAO|nr:Por secretion system C-terminal sorting domain-containing protein [Paenimyroides ummariense]